MTDGYYDTATWVLRNRLGKTTRHQLREAENQVVATALASIDEADLADEYSWELLSGIHRWLFHEVYDWAGEIRRDGIAKKPGHNFVPPDQIEGALVDFFAELSNYDPNPDRSGFIDDFARFYATLNHIHPFMEGNGRAQRAFWEPWTEQHGHPVDWSLTTQTENNEACATADDGDLQPLRDMFSRIIE